MSRHALATQRRSNVAVGRDRASRNGSHQLVHLVMKAGTDDALRAMLQRIVGQVGTLLHACHVGFDASQEVSRQRGISEGADLHADQRRWESRVVGFGWSGPKLEQPLRGRLTDGVCHTLSAAA